MTNLLNTLEKQALEVPTQPIVPANPEVSPKQARRRFTAEYKLRILEDLDCCSKHGDKGALLRKEGLYTSHITDWRRQRDEGALSALCKVRGRKPRRDSKDDKIDDLEAEINKLQAKLAQAETIIDVQKKVSEIFGLNTQVNETSEQSS